MSLILRPAVLAIACIPLLAAASYAGEIRVMTVGPESIPRRLQRGEFVDVLIVDEPGLDNLIKDGMVVAGSGVVRL